jgi:hypothetical protein
MLTHNTFPRCTVRRGFLCGRATDMQDIIAAIVAAVLAIVVAFQFGGDQ